MASPTDLSAVMRAHWHSFRARVVTGYPSLVPLVYAVVAYPQLRALFPFTSIGRLCFSRCTEFPYDVDFLVSHRNAIYAAEITLDDGGWVDTRKVGSGSAVEVAALVASLIPPHYGIAVLGTREGLPPSPMRIGRK